MIARSGRGKIESECREELLERKCSCDRVVDEDAFSLSGRALSTNEGYRRVDRIVLYVETSCCQCPPS